MPLKFKQLLEKLTSEKAPGPSPTFSVLHLLRALELVAEGPVGRAKLAESLGVGEGAVRTIISRLQDAGLIITSKTGCSLTSKGLSLWREYKSVFKRNAEIGKNELAFGDYNFAVLIKNHSRRLKSGMEQRDAAIMAGARSATTITCAKGRLIIPTVSNDVDKDFPKAAKQIIKLVKPEDNDVVIIGSGDSLEKATYGAMAAAWTLLEDC